jgi:bifunctional NMN adenylyltransferase/nudix hydrolase
MHEFHYGVFIGRFQPLHIGHQHIIDKALEQVETLIILVGSADSSRSIRNPFTFEERVHFLQTVYRYEIESGRILIAPISDNPNDDAVWAQSVRDTVHGIVLNHGNGGRVQLHGTNDFRIALAGYAKDGSSYYLKMFPSWGSIDIPTQYSTFNSTEIRLDYFRRRPQLPLRICADAILDILEMFWLTPQFSDLVEENEYLAKYREQWKGSPFPPFFVTADALVRHKGKVLLITRDRAPGRGLIALPGGFVGEHETIRRAVMRELLEETGICYRGDPLKESDLEEMITGHGVYDAPGRSLRGRVITHLTEFTMPDTAPSFDVVGGDDAREAGWFDFDQLKPSMFFEDHYWIIKSMLDPT